MAFCQLLLNFYPKKATVPAKFGLSRFKNRKNEVGPFG